MTRLAIFLVAAVTTGSVIAANTRSVFELATAAETGSGILFVDIMDKHPDWSPPQGLKAIECYDNNRGCVSCPPPAGYDGYRVQGTVYKDPGQNTFNITSRNHRGEAGKALTYYSESNLGGNSYCSDGLLNIRLPNSNGYPELYVRMWIKFQQGWEWSKNNSPLQKFIHISHYDSGNPFAYFAAGNHRPIFFAQLGKYRGGHTNVAYNANYRYESAYYPDKALPRRASNNIVYLGGGNYNGTGPEFGLPGMIGDGQWHCWEYYVKANSAVGLADGQHKFWIDGNLVLTVDDLAWSDAGSRHEPRRLWNFVQLGGNNDNQFADRAVEKEQWYAVDDLVVGTQYSGPPPKPVDVSVKTVNSASVSISWEAGKNGANYRCDGYHIYYGTSPSSLDKRVDVGNDLSHELQGLAPGKYYFRVSAYNKATYDSNENESLKSEVESVRVR